MERPRKSKRDKRGRFVSGAPKKQKPREKHTRKTARISKEARKRLGPSRFMREIVRRYESAGIEIANYPDPVEDRLLRGKEVWHWYYVEYEETFTLEDAVYLFSFFQHVLTQRYRRGAIFKIGIVIDKGGQATPIRWRTFAGVQDFRSMFRPDLDGVTGITNNVEAWSRMTGYEAIAAIGMDVRAPSYYERGAK